MKYDGYRLQLVVSDGRAQLFTREGHDWTPRFEGLRKAGEALNVKSAVIDGEAVVFDDKGISDFPALVEAIKRRHATIALAAFDLMHLDGQDLRKLPLIERKKKLKTLLGHAQGQGRARHRLRRTRGGRRRGLLQAGHRRRRRGHRVQALRRALQVGTIRRLGEGEGPPPRGRDDHRLDAVRSRPLVRLARRRARDQGQAALRRPRRHGL